MIGVLGEAMQRTIFPFLGAKLQDAGEGSYIGWPNAISDPSRVTIGARSRIGAGARFELHEMGRLIIGDDVYIEPGFTIDVDGDVTIGNGSVIGKNVRIDTMTFGAPEGAVYLSERTSILPNVTIAGAFRSSAGEIISVSPAAPAAASGGAARVVRPVQRRHFIAALTGALLAVLVAFSTATTFSLWAAVGVLSAIYRRPRIVWTFCAVCLAGLLCSVPFPSLNAFFGDNIIFGVITALIVQAFARGGRTP